MGKPGHERGGRKVRETSAFGDGEGSGQRSSAFLTGACKNAAERKLAQSHSCYLLTSLHPLGSPSSLDVLPLDDGEPNGCSDVSKWQSYSLANLVPS